MSGWADDWESSLNLANDAAKELLALDPQNPLLVYWFKPPAVPNDPFQDEEDRSHQMNDRFWQRQEAWDKKPVMIIETVVMSNYYFALTEEIRRVKAQRVPVSPS